MEEKIKIYISDEIYCRLIKDMENFEFLKADRTPNKNNFINTLIVNYHENYMQKNNALYGNIQKILHAELKLPEIQAAAIAQAITQKAEAQALGKEQGQPKKLLSIKPTRSSKRIISYIQLTELKGLSLSSYFRDMLTSYALLPQTKREQIIFKQQFDLINSAIANDRKIFLTLKHCEMEHVLSPYMMISDSEEINSYLIAEFNQQPDTFVLSCIDKVILLNEKRSFSAETLDKFDRMIKHAPQIPIRNNEKICVWLSTKGKNAYQHLTIYRPVPFKIEGDYYWFDCSREQIFLYFSNFGKHAIIVQPIELKMKMEQIYTKAAACYKDEGNYFDDTPGIYKGSAIKMLHNI